jgi:hypothetical protein
LDLLLATSNDPESKLPSVTEITEAWARHRNRLEYFLRNIEHGIITFQDEEIERQLYRLEAGTQNPDQR